ncbi:nuclear transport factor 2 family protein [Micromonospora endolithica]|nr:nuclear transport factor 2 family protein [Micromonospora endolithica]TWJ21570.1 SnoaL-like protein [Micromonospora endolithica]
MYHEDLVDQFAIQRVITEYAWFVDRRDWDALVATFADTVVVDYTAMSGGEAETLSGPEQVDRWRRELGVLDGTQHVVTGVIADVTGDTATATANVLAGSPSQLDRGKHRCLRPVSRSIRLPRPTGRAGRHLRSPLPERRSPSEQGGEG